MAIVPQANYKYTLLKEPTTEYSLVHPLFYDLPKTENGVRFRLIDSGTEPERISLCIEINEKTGIREMQECWHIVKEYQKRLKQIQGITPFGGNSFYWELSELKSHFKMSYSKIAQLVNQAIANHISDGMSFYGTPDRMRKKRECQEASDILRLCLPGMDERERAGIITGGIQNVKDGKLAFYDHVPDYPVKGDDIRERIRQFHKKTKETKQMQERW